MSEAGRAAWRPSRPVGPEAGGERGRTGGEAGLGAGGRCGGRAAVGEAARGEAERGALGEAPLELFCQPPYCGPSIFAEGREATVGKG